MRTNRREFLKTTAAGTLLAGLPLRWAGGAYAADGPETPKMRFGIIALTDCSSIVMAHELGLFKKHGIESTISKEASWAVIRDRLTLGENQASHILLGIPYAATMGLQGSPVKPMIIPMYLNRNGQAITLTKALLDRGVKTPQQLKPLALEAKAKGNPMTFAMTYPPGTHAMWMRYWLAAGGINPDRDISLITIPPAHARRLRLRRRAQGEGQVLHDLLRPADQLPAQVARRVVAHPVPALGHGQGRARLQGPGGPRAPPRHLPRGREGDGRGDAAR